MKPAFRIQYERLWNSIKLYYFDLIHYGSNSLSRLRLEFDLSAHYFMTSAYFTDDDVKLVLNFPTSSGVSFETLMNMTISGKTVVCTSHDIAPVVAKTFGIRKDDVKTKQFIAYMKGSNYRGVQI